MIEIVIPGFGALRLRYLVLDYNGTLAVDGKMLPGVRRSLKSLSRSLEIHVVTADTFSSANAARNFASRISVLPRGGQDRAKRAYVERLGREATVAIGNGRNDRLMLRAAAVGIAVIGGEGAAAAAASAADVITTGIDEALELIDNPLRLVATLRS